MNMSHCVEIIVFYLENNKWLLHLADKNDNKEEELFNEVKLKYEFVQINNVISIYERIPIENVLMIDFHVKRYMSYYGIENVRGGIYKQVFFDSKLVERLHSEIFFDYHNEIVENSEIISLMKSLKQKSDIEKKHIHNEITYNIRKMTHAEWMITNIRYFYNNETRETIDRDTCTKIEKIIGSIEYAITCIESHSNIDIAMLEEYENIIKKFPYIYNNFQKLEQHTIYKISPEIIITSAVDILKPLYSDEEYHTFDTEYIDMSLKILNYYKYMTNCIINRCDEYDFDVGHYNNLITKKDVYSMRYLEDYL